jgi:hypothetical protein
VGALVELRHYEVAVVTLDDGRWCERRAVIVVVSVHDGARRVVWEGACGVAICTVFSLQCAQAGRVDAEVMVEAGVIDQRTISRARKITTHNATAPTHSARQSGGNAAKRRRRRRRRRHVGRVKIMLGDQELFYKSIIVKKLFTNDYSCV